MNMLQGDDPLNALATFVGVAGTDDRYVDTAQDVINAVLPLLATVVYREL
jgi:hypothetical protein